MKRPSFQFYPSDWLRDTALRSCSIGARGLWMDMICFMHEGNPYGHLKVGNKVILASNLCGMVGSTLLDVEGWLDELKQAGVYGLADDGSMFSRRMIKDENLRNIRAAGGKLGGNPALKDKDKVNLKDKQKPTPSSSSASSTSSSLNTVKTARGTRLPPDFQVDMQFAVDQGLTNCLEEAAKFRDYWNSQPGQRGVKLDWQATWRNWCRSAKKPMQQQTGETAYQRAQREKMQAWAPGIAAKAPGYNEPFTLEAENVTFIEGN
jgi:hypothetical protein